MSTSISLGRENAFFDLEIVYRSLFCWLFVFFVRGVEIKLTEKRRLPFLLVGRTHTFDLVFLFFGKEFTPTVQLLAACVCGGMFGTGISFICRNAEKEQAD